MTSHTHTHTHKHTHMWRFINLCIKKIEPSEGAPKCQSGNSDAHIVYHYTHTPTHTRTHSHTALGTHTRALRIGMCNDILQYNYVNYRGRRRNLRRAFSISTILCMSAGIAIPVSIFNPPPQTPTPSHHPPLMPPLTPYSPVLQPQEPMTKPLAMATEAAEADDGASI